MADIFDLTDVWNDAGIAFAAIRMNVTDTASQAGSMLIDLQVGGVSRFAVRKDGVATVPTRGDVSSITAAGANQGAAAAITTKWSNVAVGTAFHGVRLPAMLAGDEYLIFNNSATNPCSLYPATGENFVGLSANAAIRVEASSAIAVRCRQSGVGQVFRAPSQGGITVPVAISAGNTPILYADTNNGWLNFASNPLLAANVEMVFMGPSAGDTGCRVRTSVLHSLDLYARGSIAHRVSGVASAVNSLESINSIANAPVQLAARGADSNIDLMFTPKGTGSVSFGSHSSIAAETVTGYVTIKDAGGTLRKLAVVS